MARAGEAGIDHVCCGDHVSFAGAGFDGLVQATALAMLHPALPIFSGVYLLPLRHPILVARQLADIDRIAPGRLIFGVGVGGEDRHEVSICGVNPATWGLRMNECLTVLRQLLTGEAGSFHGKFFDLEKAIIAPPAAIPLIHRRPLRCGDQAGRPAGRWLAGYLEFAPALCRRRRDRSKKGRPHRSARPFYQLPFERFERYCPYGTADDVAEFLAPYVAAGCTEFNPRPQSPDHDVSIAGTAAVKGLLA